MGGDFADVGVPYFTRPDCFSRAGGNMDRRQLNVLLVDNDEQDYITTRNLLAQIEGWQFDLEWVSTYEAAIEKMKHEQHDLCLLDYRLGEHNGLELIHQIVAQNRTPPLILLTDLEDNHVATEAMEAGVVDHLIKNQISAALLEHSIRYAVRYQQIAANLEKRVEERTSELVAVNKQLQQQIAEYKQREEVLRESSRHYQRLFDIGIYSVEVLDEQGNITDCNTTCERLLGYSREEVIGQHTLSFASDKSKKVFMKKLDLLKDRGYVEGELELVCKDGSTILVWRRSQVIYNEKGALVGSVAYSRDITERMKAVKQISTLARALEQSPMAIMVIDTAGNIEYVNFEFTELTGYTYEEVVGQNLRAFKSGQGPPTDYDHIWNTITTGDEWQGELHNLKKDGEAYWELVTITPMFNAQGMLTHFIVAQEDITVRKQVEAEEVHSQRRVGDLLTGHISDLTTANEALQREIAERKRVEEALRRSRARLEAQYKGIPIPTYSWQRIGEDFVLVDYNHTAEKATQGRIADFMGKTASEVFKDRPQVLADFARCFAEKTIVKREAPYRLVTTGETRHFVTTYNFVSPDLAIVHIEDITEHKRVEAKLKQCRGQLEVSAAEYKAELAKVNEAWQQEISKRERVVRESEERVKQVASNIDERLKEQYRSIPIPTYSWQMIGGEFVLVDFNDAAAKAMGRIVDFLGKTASEIFKDRPQILADFAQCFNEKRMIKREAPYQLVTTGETRYFVTTYNFIPPNLVIDHIEDITEHKQMEAELKQYRGQLQVLSAEYKAELAKVNEAWQQEVSKREQAEQALYQVEAELKKHQKHFEDLVGKQTSELTKANEQLQRALTQHEQAEKSMREARTRLKVQYKGIPIPTYSWHRVGEDFILVDYNNAAEKASQGRIVDFMGKTANEIFKDRLQVLADFGRCFDEKRTIKREAPYQLVTTGETRCFVTTYNFVPPNLVIVYIDDITEQKRTEEALQVSEEQFELVCRFSPDITLTFVNAAYCWYFNQDREELIGRFLPFVFDEELEKVKTHFASLDQKNPVGTIEYRVTKPNGTIRWQQWLNRAVFDRQGQLVEYQSVGQDITRCKEAKP